MTDLGEPLELTRGPAWRNRMALAPMTNRQSTDDGILGAAELEWLRRRAVGGFGLVTTCAASVSPDGRGWTGELGAWSDDHLPGLRLLAHTLSRAGATPALQISDAGARAEGKLVPDRRAPWSDPSRGVRTMTTREVHESIDEYVSAALRAELAGFSGVQVHAAHGYLVAQFLDAGRNQRDDGFGLNREGRSRFLWEIVRGVRDATSTSFQLGVRISPERWGIQLSDSLALAQELMASGLLDYIDVSLWDVTKRPEASESGELLLDMFATLDRFGVRMGVAGKIDGTARAMWCLSRGADFVSVGTAAILHADFARVALAEPTFTATTAPVSEQHLRAEGVGEAFLTYLREVRPDLMGT